MHKDKSYIKLRSEILNAPHYFAMLGVHRQSTNMEISTARRGIAKHVHPDVNGSPDASDLMARVNAAHSMLTTARDAYIHSLHLKACPHCAGSGVKKRQLGFTRIIVTPCRDCHGAGVL